MSINIGKKLKDLDGGISISLSKTIGNYKIHLDVALEQFGKVKEAIYIGSYDVSDYPKLEDGIGIKIDNASRDLQIRNKAYIDNAKNQISPIAEEILNNMTNEIAILKSEIETLKVIQKK